MLNYNEISALSIAVEKAILANEQNANELLEKLENAVSSYNEQAIDEKLSSINDSLVFLSNVYVRCIKSKISVNSKGEIKRTCELTFTRLSLLDYFNSKEEEIKNAFADTIDKTLIDAKRAGKLFVQGNDSPYTPMKQALKALVESINLSVPLDIQSSIVRLATAQFAQMGGMLVNNIVEIKARKWADIATRCLVVALEKAGKFKACADKEEGAIEKVFASLHIEKPADKPAEKPADKPADKPAEKPADKPAEKKTRKK